MDYNEDPEMTGQSGRILQQNKKGSPMTTRREFLKTASVVPFVGLFPKAEQPVESLVPSDCSQFLRSLCEEGLRQRYAAQPEKCSDGSLSKDVQERLDQELQVINDLNLVEPLLAICQIVQQAHKNDVLASVRGPAAGSLVVHALGLSQVCPLKHGLLFERFSYAGRKTPFNFDIATAFFGLIELIHYLKQIHPALEKEVTDSGLRINGGTLLPTHIGRFSMEFSGLHALEFLRGTVQSINSAHGTTIDIEKLPNADSGTFALIQQGNTDGVFQLEARGVQEFLRRLQPVGFQDLVAATVLYRPRPIESGLSDAYVTRKHGRDGVSCLHPIHEEILEETYGLVLYQEQVMQLLHRIGGIDLSDGYNVVRAIARRKNEVVRSWRAQFMDGARKRGIPEDVADHTFECVYHWGGYSYCKAHAVAQAYITYQGAYLKAHYPEECEIYGEGAT
jgi:DNA polymerase III alpha subunit